MPLEIKDSNGGEMTFLEKDQDTMIVTIENENSGYEDIIIDKSQVQKIIKHLQEQFNL